MRKLFILITTGMALCLMALCLTGCAEAPPLQDSVTMIDSELDGRIDSNVLWAREEAAISQIRALTTELLKEPLNPDAAVRIALLNNQELQASYEDVGIRHADLVQAGLLRNPEVELEIGLLESSDLLNLDLGLSLHFLDALKIPARRRVASKELSKSIWRLIRNALTLDRDVRDAFLDYYAEAYLLDFMQHINEVAQSKTSIAQSLHEAGNITDLELAQQQSAARELELEYKNLQATHSATRLRLNRLMGVWGDQGKWTHAAFVAMPDPDVKTLAEKATSANVNLRILLEEVGRNKDQYSLERQDRLVDLEEGTTFDRTRNDDEDEIDIEQLLSLSLPIFDYGHAREAKARAQGRKLFAQIEALRANIDASAEYLAQAYEAAQQRVAFVTSQQVPLLAKLMDEQEKSYNAMQIGAIDLLDTKQEALHTQMNLITANLELEKIKLAARSLVSGLEIEPAISFSTRSTHMDE